MRKHGIAVAVAAVLVAGVVGVWAGAALAAPPPATFGPPARSGTGAAPTSVATGDLNGDSRLDLAVVNYSGQSVSVLLGTGSGGFAPAASYQTATDPYALALGDLNGDTHLDLVVTNYVSNSVSVRLGSGTGGFGARTDHATGSGPYAVAIGDLDGDSVPDLAVANQNVHTVSLLLGNGSGGFGAKTDVATGLQPSAVELVDLDADAALDLVVANYGSSTVSVRLGDGAGGLGAMTEFATAPGPYSMAVDDLDGDAVLDLATSSYTSSSLSVLLGDGDGAFGPKSDVAVGALTISVDADDLNGDGFADLVAASSYSGNLSVLLGDGTGGFGSRTVLGLGATPRMVVVAELSADGRPDLVATNYYSSPSVSVLLNTSGDLGGTISVTPSSGLVDGQSVEVLGAGWAPGHAIGLCQAVALTPPGAGNCADGLYQTVVADASGAFTTSLVVRSTITVPSWGSVVDCANALDLGCVVGAADPGDVAGTAVTAALAFVPPPPTVPGAPSILRTATAGNQSATVSWTAPGSTGGSPITGYVVTPYVGFYPFPSVAFGSTATTQTVSGLTNGLTYRFRVQAVNAVGTGGYSRTTNPVTPAPTAPGAPTIIRNATAGDGSATMSWTAPLADGGSPITGYVVTPYVGYFPLPSVLFASTATTQTVTGLANGREHRFRVQAVNAIGTSGWSKVTNPVTPAA